jgi:alpha-ketoglutarate-dependent taurine dioxygenase
MQTIDWQNPQTKESGSLNISAFGGGSGLILTCEGDGSVLGLDLLKIKDLFRTSGALLFRGFAVSEQSFSDVVSPFSSQFLRDYGNSKTSDPSGGFVQSVTLGNKPVELHCENAVCAERPDIIWFYCAAPALAGGETTFCDGVEIWRLLSPAAKQLFLTRKVKYTITVPRELYLNKDQEIVLRVGTLKFAGTTYRFNDDESLTIEYVVSAVNRTKYGAELAFANSITGPYPSYRTTFVDDSEIPADVIQEIKQLQDQLTEQIAWQAGDLVMLDNSKFLHGRRAFPDTQRRIFSLMSLANF